MASSRESLSGKGDFKINGKPVTKLKVDELKQQLVARGLEKTGLKKELLERLTEALEKERDNAKPAPHDLPVEKPAGGPDDMIAIQEVSSTTMDDEEPAASVLDAREGHVIGKDDDVSKITMNESEQNSHALDDLSANKEKPEDMIGSGEISQVPEDLPKSENKNVEESEAESSDTKEKENSGFKEDGEIDEAEKKKAGVGEKRRKISLTRQTSNNPPTPGTRKRKWSLNKSKSSVVISTDSLKELIPGVQLASTPALEAVMELDDDREEESETKDENLAKEEKSLDEKSPRKKRIVKVADSKTVKLGASDEGEADNNILAENTGISGDDGIHEDVQSLSSPPPSETATPVKRAISPPRNPPSCAIHVSGLVRPFTLKQLMQYLSQFGPLTEDAFWMNKIKSHCYAVYSTVEEATNARQTMHGEHWPATSPKTLVVDFAENAKMLEDTEGALGKKEDDEIMTEPKVEEEKEEVEEESKSKGNTSKRHKEKKEKKKDEPNAASLLDQLFRKTVASPQIYWLPLTSEQAVQREKEREERRKKREMALKEEEKNGANQKPREEVKRPDEREKPREPIKAREMPRAQERRPLRDNRENSPAFRSRPERRTSPMRRRSRSRSPGFRRRR